MTRYNTQQNTTYTTTKKLGEGGEGAVFDVHGHPNLVAKIYHPHRINASLAAKVVAMTQNPPEDATRKPLNHVSIAWPMEVLYSGKQFVGYIMPKLKKSDDLYDLLQPQQRAKQHGSLNHRHLYRTARNLAIAIDAIHRKGYVLGDVNFKNALFNDDALITIVDCDSMQVTDSAGVVHRCLVGVPEYTPADLQGVDFSRVNRTPNHDAFGLAILIFQILMQGFHPFAGRPKPGVPDVEQAHIYCISKGIFPYLAGQPYEPPPAAPSMLCLPVLIQQQFERAFTQPHARPTPKDWANVLAMVETRLIPCANDTDHWYPSDGHCVICEIDYNVGRRQRTTPKPSATVQMQVPLPPLPSSSSGPLRPSAISKPQVPAPTPNTPSPAKPTTPRANPVPAPASPPPPQSRNTQTTTPRTTPSTPTLAPLVSPTPPPRVTTTIPQPARPQNSPQRDYVAIITKYVQTHRMIVIPVAVIIMALAVVIMSNLTGGSTPSSAVPLIPTDSVSSLDVGATRTRVFLPTAAAEATAVPTGVDVTCTQQGLIAAHWPMISPEQQRQMTANLDTIRTIPYVAAVLPNVFTAIEVGQSRPFSALQSACSDARLIRHNPLKSAPGTFKPDVPCADPGCLVVAPEYRLLLVRKNANHKEVMYNTNALIKQFYELGQPPSIDSIAVLADQQSTQPALQELLLPFLQTPLMTMKVDKPIWPNKITGTEQAFVDIDIGEVYFDAVNGVTEATEKQTRVIQYYRIVEIPERRWADGTKVTIADYIAGFSENINGTSAFISSITASGSSSMQITYIPGLPEAFANVTAPAALHGTVVLGDSMGDWSIRGGAPTYALTHQTVERKSFSITTVNSLQQFVDDFRMGTYELAVIEPSFAPDVLSTLATEDVKDFDTYLIPTGTMWVVQQ
ncbi:MAG: hypothetical protein RLY87_2682 [Chloroflexota bacterium]